MSDHCPSKAANSQVSGSEIVDQVISGEAQWSALFAKHDFFFRYRFYLQVIASSPDLDIQNKWQVLRVSKGFCD